MVTIKKNTIVMTRGDTLVTTIKILDADGNEYIPDQGDELRFALKENYEDDIPIIHKNIPISTMQLRLESEDTKKLRLSDSYYYDIQLTYGDNIVSTIISGKLITKGEVM